MGLIKQIDKMNDQWMTWIETSPTSCEILFHDHEPTEAEAQDFVNVWNEQHQYDNVPHLPIAIYGMMEVIEAAVKYIKTTASLTLTKWNTYLNTLSLEDRYAVRWFIVVMARKLSEIGEITLSDNTETQILAQMKTWFINTPARKIRKIFYGEA